MKSHLTHRLLTAAALLTAMSATAADLTNPRCSPNWRSPIRTAPANWW